MSRWMLLSALTLAAFPAAHGEDPAISIIQKQCLACHGAAHMGGLDLRQRETVLRGGSRGPALVPGKAGESLLLKAVTRTGDLKMPPGKQVLAADEIDAIRRWIDQGAPWDADASQAVEPSWWSFRKPKHFPVPEVRDRAWVKNPIDAFILAKLEQKGLHPAPPAERRTLVRRAYFDLHGLPPAPDDVQAFVDDTRPDAWEKLVDRLLASPRYGERWGRQWLDVVRYADTGGFETDIYYANAWRYRDYVIKSFNDDKPYNRFVQ